MKNNIKWGVLEVSIVLLIILFIVLLAISIFPNSGQTGMMNAINGAFGIAPEREHPSDVIKENQIEVYDDMIIIRISGANISRYSDTNSMDPIIDSTANGIEVPVTSTDQVHIGDIIAFQPNGQGEELIVHRVVEIGYDNEGWFCVTKGDNNNQTDGKIRFPWIKFKTIMIIY